MIKKVLATTLATLSVASMSLPAMAIKEMEAGQGQHTNSQQSINTQPSGDSIGGDFETIKSEDVQLFTQKEDYGFVILDADKEQKAEINNSMKQIDYEVIKKQVKDCKESGLKTVESYENNDVLSLISNLSKTAKKTLSVLKTANNNRNAASVYVQHNAVKIVKGFFSVYKWFNSDKRINLKILKNSFLS